MTNTIQTRPITKVTGLIELVQSPNPKWGASWTVVINPGRWERRSGGYDTEAAAQDELDTLLDEAEAKALREADVDAFLDRVEARCDQCGSKLPASRRCTECE